MKNLHYLLISFTFKYISAARILSRPQDVVYRNGVDTLGYMACSVQPSSDQQFWVFRPEQTVPGSTGGVIWANGKWIPATLDQKLSIATDIQTSGNCSLVIRNLERSDSGTYTFQSGDANDAKAEVIVADPPEQAFLTPVRPTFVEDETVTFTCASDKGYPAPDFKWMKGAEQLAEDSSRKTPGGLSSSELTIRLGYTDHLLDLSCEASNALESSTAIMQLRVEYIPKVVVNPQNLTVLKGEAFSLSCSYSANPEEVRIAWLQDSNVIQPEQTGQTLSKPDGVVIESIFGCRATNGIGAGTAFATVTVHYSPIVTIGDGSPILSEVKGQEITLTCNINSNPQPDSIRWLKGHLQTEIGNSASLTIQPLSKDDAGLYFCEVVNTVSPRGIDSVQTSTANVTLEVLYGPMQPNIQADPSAPVDGYNAGQSVTLTCETSDLGNPTGSYRWYRQDRDSETLSTEPNYTVTDGQADKIGQYTCEVSNTHGTKTANFLLKFRGIPVLENQQLKVTESFAMGDRDVRFKCIFQGFPRPELMWYKDGDTVREEDGLTITETVLETLPYRIQSEIYIPKELVKEYRYGKYQCKGANSVGEASQTFDATLDLTFKPKFDGESRAAGDVGISLTISCNILSNPAVTEIQFQRDSSSQNLQTNSKYMLGELQTNADGLSYKQRKSFTIQYLQSTDIGMYFCQGSNVLGEVRGEIQVSMSSEPEAPYGLVEEETGWGFVTLSWTPGFNGGFKQTFFVDISNYKIVNTTAALTTITGLIPSTTYSIKVMAENRKGPSEYGPEIEVTTSSLELPVPSAVLNQDSGQIVLGFNVTNYSCIILEGKIGKDYSVLSKTCDSGVNMTQTLYDIPRNENYQTFRAKICLDYRVDICGKPGPEIVNPFKRDDTQLIGMIVGIVLGVLVVIAIVIIVVCCVCRRMRNDDKPALYNQQGHVNPVMTKSNGASVNNLELRPSKEFNLNSYSDEEDPIESTHYAGQYGATGTNEGPTPPHRDVNIDYDYEYASVHKKPDLQNKLNEMRYADRQLYDDRDHSQHSNSDNTGDDEFDEDLIRSAYRQNDLSFISDGNNIPFRRPSFSESGYSTPDSRLKKIVYEVIV